MTIQEAIEVRHSVRAYKDQPLTEEVAKRLEEEIAVVNQKGNLHVQLIQNEPRAFQGTLAKYGKFRNANNYLVMAGKRAEDLDERVGYYGEHLVLLAQTLGLNTCWVGLSYSKVPGTYVLELTISERIWQAILELVAAIIKVFSIVDEEVMDALVNESDELAHICELYQCKMAS